MSNERDQNSVVRQEEELYVRTVTGTNGADRARKRVESERVVQDHDREIEVADDVERAPAREGDSGEVETLPDGSVSIPLFEERLVVHKELFVRERVIVRKRTVTEQHRIEAQLRKEQIEVEGELEGAAGASSGGSLEEETR